MIVSMKVYIINYFYFLIRLEGIFYGFVYSEVVIDIYKKVFEDVKNQGGKIVCGGKVRYNRFGL